MNGKRDSVYWDACCFINLINRKPCHESKYELLDQIYNDANAGGILIVTSTISIVETNHTLTEQRGQPLDSDALNQIHQVVFNRTAVRLIDFVLPIATVARDLIRTAMAPSYGVKLKTADAIHLASAVRFQTASQQSVGQIHTYEKKWSRYQPIIGEVLRISEPNTMYVKNLKAPSVFE